MAFEDVIAVLQTTPLISLLEPDALRIVAFSADTRRLGSGEILFRRGERSDGGYVVIAGAIAVGRQSGPEGDGNVMRAGALIGRIALFTRGHRPASAVSIEPSSLLRISPTLMRRVLQEFPDAADRMRGVMTDDLDGLAAALAVVGRAFEGPGR